jgi:tRNA threonylcarbamoyladenosine biosynthesis protein TsaB
VLSVDTATRRATVAAVCGGQLLHRAQHEQPRTHAERLPAMIDEVLAGAGWARGQVDLLAVGQGPGSFTGVRVGMALAKGLGLALGIPLVGVNSLEAMAYAGRSQLGAIPLASLLDAKKSEVFVASYDGRGEPVAAPRHIPREQVGCWFREQAGALGAHLRALGEVVSELEIEPTQTFRHPSSDLPEPFAMALIAAARWAQQPYDQLDVVEPMYIRPPDINLHTSNSTPTRVKA